MAEEPRGRKKERRKDGKRNDFLPQIDDGRQGVLFSALPVYNDRVTHISGKIAQNRTRLIH